MHRRVHVGEGKLVGRQCAVRVHVPLAQQQDELRLGEGRVDARELDRVEREVPRGIPRVFPGVGHEDHVAVEDVRPVPVATPLLALLGWRRLRRVALKPARHLVIIELLRPKQPGMRLPHDAELLALRRKGDVHLVKPIRLLPAHLEQRGKIIAEGVALQLALRHQPQAHAPAFTRRDGLHVVRRRLGADAGLIDRVGAVVDQRLMKCVLNERLRVRHAEEPLHIRLVLREQNFAKVALVGRIDEELEIAQRGMAAIDLAVARATQFRLDRRVLRQRAPRPGVAEPKRRQQVQRGLLRPTIGRRELDENVVGPGLGVLDLDVEIAVLRERLRVGDLILRHVAIAAGILL